MIPRIGYVLRHLRQEIQRIEDLEIALRTGQQILAGGFREAAKPIVPGLVDDFALTSDFDHSRLAERTPQKILDQPLQNPGVFGLHLDALIHAEPGVLPTADVGDDLIGDLPLDQQELENFLFPQFEKRFRGQLGQQHKRALREKNPFGNQRVKQVRYRMIRCDSDYGDIDSARGLHENERHA